MTPNEEGTLVHAAVLDADDLLADDPYPLGVPERVMEVERKRWAEMFPTEPRVLFTIDLYHVLPTDMRGIEMHVLQWLGKNGCDLQCANGILSFISVQWREGSGDRIHIGYHPGMNWCVKREPRA